jgi:hypothetical protein
MEIVAEDDGWRWCDDADEVVVVVGCCVCKHEAGGGLGAENHETECDNSVSGAPCERTVKGDGGRWWCGAGKLVVVVGLCVRKCEVGEWAGDQKSQNMASWVVVVACFMCDQVSLIASGTPPPDRLLTR